MREAFQAPAQDRYQVLTEHEPSHLILEGAGLGFERTDTRALIQITTRLRSRKMKERLFALAVENLGKHSGLPPEGVAISCIDNDDVDWSFDKSQRMREVVTKLDPSGSKSRAQVSNLPRKVPNLNAAHQLSH